MDSRGRLSLRDRSFELWNIRWRRMSVQRLQKCDDLPALRLGQVRPNRHASPDNAIGEDPEKRAGRCLLYFLPQQAWTTSCASCFSAVTVGAMLFEELSARDRLLSIALEGVLPNSCCSGSSRQRGVHGLAVLLRRGVIVLRQR